LLERGERIVATAKLLAHQRRAEEDGAVARGEPERLGALAVAASRSPAYA